MTADEEIAALRAENAHLRAALATALERIAELEAQLAGALPAPPAPSPAADSPQKTPLHVRPNAPKRPDGERPARKKRAAEHNTNRRRAEPTEIVEHRLEACPDCRHRLWRHCLAYSRQIIEIPPPPPVAIIEHRLLKGYCPTCDTWHTPPADWSGQVIGQGRFGVRLCSLIAYLRTTLRQPIETIQAYLATLHGLTLSQGGISGVLEQVGRVGKRAYRQLLAEARASPWLHADETSWREDGQSGWQWTLTTTGLQAVRYYRYTRRRAGRIARALLANRAGVLITDCLNVYDGCGGIQQRCWVHLLRDLRDLRLSHRGTRPVVRWARRIATLYYLARRVLRQELSEAERASWAERLAERTRKEALLYAQMPDHPCRALCKRLLRYLGEWFVFVRIPGVPAENNAAERSLRPTVIQRKISGGTRSRQGTKTRMVLASLFGTWQARGQNPFEQCLALLSQ